MCVTPPSSSPPLDARTVVVEDDDAARMMRRRKKSENIGEEVAMVIGDFTAGLAAAGRSHGVPGLYRLDAATWLRPPLLDAVPW